MRILNGSDLAGFIKERQAHQVRGLIQAHGVTPQLAIVEKMRPDIILLDLRMPEMDGAAALKAIRSHEWGKDIPVLVLTNVGEEEAPHELRELGILGYIVKADLTPRQVTERVKEALAK